MANFYWVGGTGSWSEFATHWATASGGGTFHANAPTSSDDVFIDANSGFGSGGTITIDNGVTATCNDFSCTSGHTFTITPGISSSFNFFGTTILEAGLTFNLIFDWYGTTPETITVNGATLNNDFYIEDVGTLTLQDDLEITGEFYIQNGTFDANDHNITATNYYFYADIGFTPTVVMGSGTWEGTGDTVDDSGPWSIYEVNGQVVTIIPETSTIKFTNTDADNKTILYSAGDCTGKTYHNLWIDGNGTGVFIIEGDNTFADLKITAGNTVKFTVGTTTTLTTFTATGTEGNLITLNSSDGLAQFTLSKASGVVNCDYLNISNSNATGGATWYAGSHSADTANNDGWIFTDAPTTNRHYYYDDD